MIKPTILIGHGRFGLEVLQRLLDKTAPRGALERARDPRSATGAGEYRLRDLALLWMPAGGDAPGALDRGGGPDFIRDLYRQIREVEHRPGEAERALCEAVAEASRWLRLPEVQARRGRDGLPGLDVIVLAQVRDPDAIGTLDNLTRAVLKRLVDEVPDWAVAQQAARKLNCIEVLDFDNFRRAGAEGVRIRRALQRSLEAWKGHLDGKRPALDRCYLTDGSAHDAHRDQKARYDEVTLFLELLLFSGLRANESLKDLFEQRSQTQEIAAAFGIRLMERGPELLSRVAAARFGAGWIPYLRGGRESGFAPPAAHLAERLGPLVAQARETGTGAAEIRALWQQEVTALAAELMEIGGQESTDWPARARRLFTERTRALELRLNRAALEQVRAVRDTFIEREGAATPDQTLTLDQAITRDLHDAYAPVPLASVLAQIKTATDGLGAAQRPDAARPADPRPDLTTAAAAHGDYLVQHAEWIQGFGRGLNRLWPIAAAVLGLGLTPFVCDLVRYLPLLAAADSPWHRHLVDAVLLADRPVFVAPVVVLLLWVVLRFGVGPGVVRSIRRARDFHLDAVHGRLSAAIRRDCESLGGLCERVLANLRATLAADLLQVLEGLRDRLERRDRELEWLRRQLGEFLIKQGFQAASGRLDPPENSVHLLVQDDGDLTRMMAVKPLSPEQFKCHQEALPRPFEGWSAPFSHTFLDLFGFVEVLSRPYRDKFRGDLGANSGSVDSASVDSASVDSGSAEWQRRQAALGTFLDQPGFRLGFTVAADKRESQEESYCLLPESWSGQPGVRERLRGIGVTDAHVLTGADPSRLYLIKCRFNIGPQALDGSP